ncbi:MAG: ethylbenzene dehydrogenase-related protein [Pirellulales bacterium]
MWRAIKSDRRMLRLLATFWIAVGCGLFVLCGCSPPAVPPAAKNPEQIEPAAATVATKEAVPSAAEQVEPVPPPMDGPALFAQHCAGCHGDKGDGNSPLATFLYPKPRDFRSGRFRLVSTTNGVPSAADLDAVLRRGMPGSSMPPWPKLTDADRAALVAVLQTLHRDGMRELYLAHLREEFGEDDPEVDEQELAAFVANKTTPGELAATPDIAEATDQAIERGRQIYVKQSCHSCHGAEGKGDGQQAMVDVEGYPTRARDLTRGIYKGGHDPASVYRRIAFGMPGTPMPSSLNLTSDQIVDLVHFIRSLSDETTRRAAELRRERIVAKRVAAISTDDDGIWESASAVTLRTTPIWWRDGADRDLTVAAVHDGKLLAIRLSWPDETENLHAPQPEQFKDLAAVQLFSGAVEPFLGMGAAKNTLDVWQWRAGMGEDRDADSQLDDYPFDTPTYRDLAGGQPLPDFIAARAAGNPMTDADRAAWSLAAKGPGSLTFLPRPSQLVTASAKWKDGRWTVTMARPLAVPPDAGLALAAGKRYSAAFALWDGAARDRAGQKAITIWQDLTLE